jgi:dihydrofolate synthase / folylpolyglutamate synthase
MISSEIYYNKLQKKYSRKINLDRKRIFKVLKKLKFPHLNLKKPINLIGSDGKYTTGINLLNFIEANKKNTTFFQSPHLVSVCHRFRLKKKFINLNQIQKYEDIIDKTRLKLTLFEALTMIYLLAANNQKKIDYNICEAGAGFEADSTNLWEVPEAQIITNINLQHLDLFKVKTLEEVVKIKVGYLSKNTKIYIGKQTPKVLKIIKKILKKNTSKITYPSTWKIIKSKNKYSYKDRKNTIPIKSRYIHSEGLLNNLGLAIKVALDFNIAPSIIKKTIPKINYEGRMQYVKKGKLRKYLNKNEELLLDGAHSNTSGKNLFNYLKTIKLPIYCVWGMQKNKVPDQFLKEFKGIFKKIITVKIPNEANSCPAKQLMNIANDQNYNVEIAKGIKQALQTLSSKEKKLIVVMGSLYWVGSVLKEN